MYDERVKRPSLERTEPHRAWGGVFASPGAPGPASPFGEADSHAHEASGDRPEAAASTFDTINGAYRMIDEYLREAQHVAEKAWQPFADGATPGDGSLDRVVRAASDLGMAWLEMWQQLAARDDAQRRPPAGAMPGPFKVGGRQESAPLREQPWVGRSEAELGLSIVIESQRPAQLSVELQPLADPSALAAGPLSALEPSAPPIHAVSLELPDGARCLRVHVHVPDAQPPGVYHGVLIDRNTQRSRGTISLTLR